MKFKPVHGVALVAVVVPLMILLENGGGSPGARGWPQGRKAW